jgi:DNA polymerase III sliding clamp (beta) subunit (PCNA family)
MSKITVNAKQLAEELSFVAEATNNHVQLNPNYTFILFEAKDNVLRLTGTDGIGVAQTTITLDKPAQEEMIVAAKAQKLAEIMKKVEVEEVTLSLSASKFTITAGKGRYSFNINPDAPHHITSFASLPVSGKTYDVDTAMFLTGLTAASSFTPSKEDTQYTLMSVGMTVTPNFFQMYSTDGKQAIELSFQDAVVTERDDVLKIETDFLPTIRAMKGKRLQVIHGDSAIRLQSENRMFTFRKKVGNLPPIQVHIINPAALNENHIVVDVKSLRSAANRLQVAVSGKNKKIVFKVDATAMNMRTIDPLEDTQEFEEEIEIKGSVEGDFSINGGNLIDFLRYIDGEVKIGFKTPPGKAAYFESGNIRYATAIVK